MRRAIRLGESQSAVLVYGRIGHGGLTGLLSSFVIPLRCLQTPPKRSPYGAHFTGIRQVYLLKLPPQLVHYRGTDTVLMDCDSTDFTVHAGDGVNGISD